MRKIIAAIALLLFLVIPTPAAASGHAIGCSKSSWQYGLNYHAAAYCSGQDSNYNYNGLFRITLTLYFPQQGGYGTYYGPYRLAGAGYQSNVDVSCGVGYYSCQYSSIGIQYI